MARERENADAKNRQEKIVTPKFVLGFCHGQLRFCLLVSADRP